MLGLCHPMNNSHGAAHIHIIRFCSGTPALMEVLERGGVKNYGETIAKGEGDRHVLCNFCQFLILRGCSA